MAALGALAGSLLATPAAAEVMAPLAAHEIERILAHGPWPPPVTADPSNRLLGNADAIELGRRLFHDVRLSRFGVLACASCHKPELDWTDGRMRASGAARLERNTPTLLDVAYNTWFGWDGGADSLWAQSIRPILDRREMAARPEDVRELIAGDPQLAAAYRQVAGSSPAAAGADRVLVVVAKALAAWQATLISGRTPFDALRDRLAAGERGAGATADYPAAALRGLRLFIGEAGCSRCHAGPRFTDGSFHAVPPPPGVAGDASVRRQAADRGRRDALARLAASPYRRHGPYSDAPGSASATLVTAPADLDAYRVPGLRGVALTAPYMHDGSRASLADAVDHGAPVRPLDARDVADLVAFLATLSP